ncbi:MAG: GTP cyclohydrolase MptA [Thermoplasmata archaeon]
MDFLDVQSTRPSVRVGVDQVGVKDIEYPLFLNGSYFFLKVSLFVDIPSTRKGADMSRAVEAIENTFKSLKSNEDFSRIGLIMTEDAMKRFGYSNLCQLTISGNYFVPENGHFTKYKVFLNTIRARDGKVSNYIGSGYTAITACPCAMETTRTLLNRDFPGNEQLISEMPSITHNQRNFTKLLVQDDKGNISIDNIIRVMKNVIGKPLNSLLKRKDEGELVYDAHKNPMFVEDVVRNIAMCAIKDLDLDEECLVRVSSDSDESIHPHNAFAMISKKVKDIKREMNAV